MGGTLGSPAEEDEKPPLPPQMVFEPQLCVKDYLGHWGYTEEQSRGSPCPHGGPFSGAGGRGGGRETINKSVKRYVLKALSAVKEK